MTVRCPNGLCDCRPPRGSCVRYPAALLHWLQGVSAHSSTRVPRGWRGLTKAEGEGHHTLTSVQ